MYKNHVKRFLDIIFALVAAPLVILVGLFVCSAIYIEDRGSIFYKAKRRGINGKVFNMYKFRSMKVNAPDLRNADNSTFNSEEDPRVTKTGKVIRKTSIDELPQVFNILNGDMSWIGPRATIPIESHTWDDLNDEQKKRLTIRPGITGYTAALYRNSISGEEKIKFDCYYVDNMNFILDFKIIFWTVKSVLLRKNLYTNNNSDIMKKEVI